MTAGIVAAVLVGAAVVAWVAAPLFRRDATEAERVTARLSQEADLESRREMLLSSLRELEDDRETGKIDEHDFEELHARMSAEAVEVMHRLDALGGEPVR